MKIILFSHHTSSQCCKARRFDRVAPAILKWLGQPGRNVVPCNTDCWCGEKKVLAMNTQQEPTLKNEDVEVTVYRSHRESYEVANRTVVFQRFRTEACGFTVIHLWLTRKLGSFVCSARYVQ